LNNLSRKNYDQPIVDGSILSENYTPTMKGAMAILEYIGKIVLGVSEQDAIVKTQKKQGLPYFLKEKERIEKLEERKLTPQELQDLENKTRYEIFPSKIGNKTEMMRLLFMTVCTEENPFWKKISEQLRKESAEIAQKVFTIEQATDDNDDRNYL